MGATDSTDCNMILNMKLSLSSTSILETIVTGNNDEIEKIMINKTNRTKVRALEHGGYIVKNKNKNTPMFTVTAAGKRYIKSSKMPI